MVFNPEDYKKWAKKDEANGGEPCITRFLRYLVYKDVNTVPKNKHEDLEKLIQENQQFLNDVCRWE